MSKYTLTYRKGRSQEIYIEEVKKGNDYVPYFEQEYDEARKLIKEIIDSQEPKIDGHIDDQKRRKEKWNKIKKYGCNNRILFTGQRGSGKTSVMHSLADYLAKQDIKLQDQNGKDVDAKYRFSSLPMVDPSHFDNNNNILLTVITSMFSEAKKKMNKDKDGGDTANREDLLKQFEKVFKSLDSIKSELSSYTLESLNRKSDAEDLKDKMKDLVDKYLIFQGCGDESRLVLLIDDIDMSVSYAPEMLEQLRKYLELDNLIILMSANLGQLSNEMREKYSSAFQYTLKDSNQALSIDVEDLATKYLLKLFPTSRRINVERHTNQLLETDLRIEILGKEPITGIFQKVILSQIWSKTRLLFIPKDPENTLHPIIPTNLRDLAQFLDMLESLDDVNPGDKTLFDGPTEYDNCEKNLQRFKRYVTNTWIPNHLSVDEELVFKNIPADITEINKHLINSINKIGTLHKKELMSREVGLDMIEKHAENINIDRDIYTMVSPNDPKFVKANKISDIFNQPSNYSYGDLLLMIDKYETYFESEEHRKFTDAIKIYYSILLFETMFFKSQNVDYEYVESNSIEKYPVIPIQKLIGGTVYYPNYFEIITSKYFTQKGPSFDAKRAFYHKISVQGNDKVGKEYPPFSVLYYGDIRPDRYDTKHIYDTTFDNDAKVDNDFFVTFDILSILNNMLNPCHTICRMGNRAPSNINFKRWGEANKIVDEKKNTTTFLPNAILPFYSVDIMLQYLKESIPLDNVKNNLKDNKEREKNSEDYTLLSHDEITKLQDLLNFDQPDSTEKGAILKESTLAEFLSSSRLNVNVKDENNKDIEDATLKKNSEILKQAKLFKTAKIDFTKQYSRIPMIDSYRDYVVTLIVGGYEGGTRERDQLIKNLYKYNSCAEIFEHLFSVLYKDAFREKTVRWSSQKAVHSEEFVHYYYNKLWENTEKMLGNVTFDKPTSNLCITPIKVYKGIYNNAIACFVMKPQAKA